MAADKLSELLQGLKSHDNNIRTQAEKMYTQSKIQHPEQITTGLLQILASPGDSATRLHVAVLVRRLLLKSQDETQFVWKKLQASTQTQVAAGLLQLFEREPEPAVQRKVGDILEALAATLFTGDNATGWPDFLPTVFRIATSATVPKSREAAIRLISDCLIIAKQPLKAAKAELGGVIQGALADVDLGVKVAGMLLVLRMVEDLDKADWQPLQATAPTILQNMQAILQAKEVTKVEELVERMIETASESPLFFKPQFQDWVGFFTTIARAKGDLDQGVRKQCLEWIVQYAEKKPKFVSTLPGFNQQVIETCMTMMLEVDDGQEELRMWASRMDDEEGDEDEDEVFHAGEQSLDRLANSLGMEVFAGPLFQAIGKFAVMEPWTAKHAAFAAIRQTCEYIEEESHVDEVAKLLLASVAHPHPRVRYTSLHAIGQLANDQAPYFQEHWYEQVLELLAKMMDDQIDRVAAMSMSAFVSFGERLEQTIMHKCAHTFMTKLANKLNTSKHRGVREESITSIAVIAGVIEKQFSQYYGQVMPILKQFVMQATGDKENRLRGKAFECMSLLGVAVGKDQFKGDAQEALSEMMKTQCMAGSDNVQKEYVKEATERICQVLQKDFAPFMPMILPHLLETLNLSAEDAQPNGTAPQGDDDIGVYNINGKMCKVKTTRFQEIAQTIHQLNTFCREMEGSYYDYVQPTAQALLPLLAADEDLAWQLWDTTVSLYNCWSQLIKCARIGAEERKLPNTVASELLKTFLEKVLPAMQKEGMSSSDDGDTLGNYAQGVAECIKNAGPNQLGEQQCQQIVQSMFQYIDCSFQRSEVEKKNRDEDDDEEWNPEDEDTEQICRRMLEEVMGAIMETAPTAFVPCLQTCGQKIQLWLTKKEGRVLAFDLSCHIIEHLKGQGKQVWSVFMEPLIAALHSADSNERLNAAWAMNVAAELPDFAEAAPIVFQKLAQWIQQKPPKKREDKAKLALDNAVAALLRMAEFHAAKCPQDIDPWALALTKLPLKEDMTEGQKVHKKLVELTMAQNQGLLGPGNKNLGKLLSVLADVAQQECLVDKETDKQIVNIFKNVPADMLAAHASGFTEIQKNKIQKMKAS